MTQELELVERAREFAAKAHSGLFRKNRARELAIVHPEEVECLVRFAGGTDEERAAALLHDCIEDAGITLDEVLEKFGESVKLMVDGLTDLPEFAKLHTLERKTRQAERVRSESRSVKLIKLADQISNTRCIGCDPPVNWDDAKCREYVEGAREIAVECRGISEFLDRLFESAHEAALRERKSDFS